MSVVPIDEPVVSLAERADRIEAIFNRTAMEVGEELIAAKQDHPFEWVQWVITSLPFGLERAERIMAVCNAFRTIDPGLRDRLPSAASALYELSRLPVERVAREIEAGVIDPSTTAAEAARIAADRSPLPHPNYVPPRDQEAPIPKGLPSGESRLTADLIAGELVRRPRDTLSVTVEAALRWWLDTPIDEETSDE